MANERKTESLVRTLLHENGYYNDENVIVEEQSSDNPKVHKLLQAASKSGLGQGFPEFIISFLSEPENLVVIECKADTNNHESPNRDRYRDYAVDGALLYASHLKEQFNVVAIAVSGETEREIRISHFLWLKKKQIYKDVSDKHILNIKSLFYVIREQSKPIREEELVRQAIQYNRRLKRLGIPEGERCTLISAILVALQDRVFVAGYKSHHSAEEHSNFNPNESLIGSLLISCENVLKKNNLDTLKREKIIREYEKIRQVYKFQSPTIQSNNGQNTRNTILRDLIDDINENVLPYVNEDAFDVLGKFYTQFIRYAGSDQSIGLVLTPTHITDFFCELADVHPNDRILDPCCGTGGFLVSAMNFMMKRSGNDLSQHDAIKGSQLIGIEMQADMFSHACSNMMMRGDGKSHIYYNDCFNENLKHEIRSVSPSKVFLNPPYDAGDAGQLKFVENAMDFIVSTGICIAICQMSAAISDNSEAIEIRRRLLEKHTLEAVFSLPNDLFYPVGVVTCIIIFSTGIPHPAKKETFFGYFKDDGFTKVKNKGRIDERGDWTEIKNRWLDVYTNRKTVPGLSVMERVTANDEWCAEAYMATDYSQLRDEEFVSTMKQYIAFKFLRD